MFPSVKCSRKAGVSMAMTKCQSRGGIGVREIRYEGVRELGIKGRTRSLIPYVPISHLPHIESLIIPEMM
jgi:hypothetical protein